MKPKNIKHYKCGDCGYRGDRSKTLQIGGFGFAKCFKCGSLRIKETPEWLEWAQKERERYIKEWGL